MLRPWLEAAIEALFSSGRIDVHVACRFRHDSRAEKPFDQPETDISPREHSAAGQHVAVVDHHALRLCANVGKLRSELICEGPMGRGLPPGQQTRPRKEENTPTYGCDNCAL